MLNRLQRIIRDDTFSRGVDWTPIMTINTQTPLFRGGFGQMTELFNPLTLSFTFIPETKFRHNKWKIK